MAKREKHFDVASVRFPRDISLNRVVRDSEFQIMDMTIVPETQPWAVPGLCRLTYASPVDGASDWAMLLPPGAGDPTAGDAAEPVDDQPLWKTGEASLRQARTQTWIINLHGHGSTGSQLYTRQDVRQRWLPRFMRDGYGILSPNLRGNAWMNPKAVADLHALISHLRTKQHARRFILVSGSMGGTGSLIYAALHPEHIDAVVAMCPATDLPSYYQWCAQNLDRPIIAQIHDAIAQGYARDESLMAKHSALAQHDKLTMPIFIAHGDADKAIPVRQAMALNMLMKDRPGFEYVQLPGGNHDDPLWLMDRAMDWIQSQLG